MASLSLARHETAGRVEGSRLTIRYAHGERLTPGEDGSRPTELCEGVVQPGTQRIGPFELALSLDGEGASAELAVRVRNLADEPLHLESVGIGVRWLAPPSPGLRFLRHGWQSWSFTGGLALDDGGTPPFPSGSWLRGFHHGLGAPPEDRSGWHESDLVSVAVAPGAGACLLGALERGVATGVVYLAPEPGGARIECELQLELPLAPGAALEPEPVRLALGTDENVLLEQYASGLGARAGARTDASFQAGWCSWYQFFHDIDESRLLRNLDALVKHRDQIPIDVVQLDDGYQRAIGDWLLTNPRFPRGLAPIAEEIRTAGFRPGIWTAPFCVTSDSRVFQAHPDWLLRQGDEFHKGLIHPVWAVDGWVYVLDTTRQEVRDHLLRVFAGLTGMGFTYHKIDFLYCVALQADAADRGVTRAGRLRLGLESVRRGAGEDAFVLGCGCPIGPAVGMVDGMRIGPDVAPRWHASEAIRIPGLESAEPSASNAIRNVLSRAWMHRRLWLNDPDCLMVRTRDTDLSADEVRTLAATIATSGGMAIVSDDLPALSGEDVERMAQSIALAREVDSAAQAGTARAIDLTGGEFAAGLASRAADAGVLTLVNPGETERRVSGRLADWVAGASGLSPTPLLGTRAAEIDGERLSVALAPHESICLRVPRAPRIAVFCDYDGTFALQDVGSTIAKRHAGSRRLELWDRLSRGELSAWEYNMELLDGLEFSEEQLDAFLQTIEIDPGGRDLLAWCAAHDVPFRVLSDGFDRNLDRLQELHGVRFAYDANRLWYDDGRWRLAPGSPDPTCGCGTGVCKRGHIGALRAAHPDTITVHVGNGRVSDLCAAEAAHVVFAKDSLAEELRARGIAFESFRDLNDVRGGLASLLDRLDSRG